jgi:hypothetical protein
MARPNYPWHIRRSKPNDERWKKSFSSEGQSDGTKSRNEFEETL